MRSLLKIRMPFSSRKLGIADTAKVIQDKILNISQVVALSLYRTMSKNTVQSSVLVMVLPESLVSTKSRQVKWSSSGQASEVWPSISKQTMSVSSSSVTIGNSLLI